MGKRHKPEEIVSKLRQVDEVRDFNVSTHGDKPHLLVRDLSLAVGRGIIMIEGERVEIATPSDAIAHGMALMAQDRRDALIIERSIADKISLASLSAVTP